MLSAFTFAMRMLPAMPHMSLGEREGSKGLLFLPKSHECSILSIPCF